jgi:hypothetical protein
MLACVIALLPPESVPSQSVRVSGATSVRYIELRPLHRDSVPANATEGEELLRQLPDGSIVRCISGEDFCRQVRPGPAASAYPVTQDIDITAWGLGRGTRVTAQLRGRQSLGANDRLWPRQDDPFDVLSLYGEMERDTWRARLGRQWRVSGLGFYNFDGASVTVRPRPSLWLEAFGGRSLVRGLNESRTGAAMESPERLSTPNAGVLFGLQGRYRRGQSLAVGAVYQLDVRGDRRGAYAELAAADAAFRLRLVSIEGSVEYDLAGQVLNHARATFRPPPLGRVGLFAEARRYHPYFEQWTIWGAFSPVGFDEVRGGLTWAARDGRVLLRSDASYRRYGDAQTEAPDEFRTSGWGIGGGASWAAAPSWRLDASTRLESGFGAGRWDGNATLRRELGVRGFVALQASAFQRAYEFRLGEGTVIGLGAEGAHDIGGRSRVIASFASYRQHGGIAGGFDWNQTRASLRIEWTAGTEPATPTSTGGRR